MLTSLRDKILPLADDTVVLPGHGPATTIGRERATQPVPAWRPARRSTGPLAASARLVAPRSVRTAGVRHEPHAPLRLPGVAARRSG